jgi:DNA-binding transcriptional MerR regulator
MSIGGPPCGSARRSGLTTSSIRFYEARGLLNIASRTANGYREYRTDALTILAIIVGAQRTGFSLQGIKQILPADRGSWRRGGHFG